MSPKTLSLVVLLLPVLSVAAAAHRHGDAASELVRSSCLHANYPDLCVRTLAPYSAPARTARDLAVAAVNVSLAQAGRASRFLKAAAAQGSGGGGRRQRSALGDCVEQISDTVEELGKALAEIRQLRGETFRWQMSNAQTWVSAALTNEDTCLDGFQGVSGKFKSDVHRRITNVARVTSNALYMVNRLDESRGKHP